MPGLNELDFSIGAIEGAKHAVDAIAGITEDVAYIPVVKTPDEKITYSLGHGKLQLSTRRSANKREAGGVPIVPRRGPVSQREKPTSRIGFYSAPEARELVRPRGPQVSANSWTACSGVPGLGSTGFAGNCRTTTRCPGVRLVSSTMAPFENSSAS